MMLKLTVIVLICLSGLSVWAASTREVPLRDILDALGVDVAPDAAIGVQPLPIQADFLPPTHVDTATSITSATVSLQANALDTSEITSAMVLCYDASTSEFFNVTLPVEDNIERAFEVIIPDLNFNTHYSCIAQWLPAASLFSTSFEFTTMDVPVKRVSVSGVRSNEFTLSWDETESVRSYVESYAVVIRAVEPNHFIQESCEPARDVTYIIPVAAGDSTYTFPAALPNYRYEVSTVTTMRGGIERTTDIVTVFTPSAAPGRIRDLGGRFLNEQCARYAASGLFTWTPPCDINGRLNRFEATVTAFYTIGDDQLQHSYTKTLTAEDADENYQFAIEIPMNPFFRYSLSINTFAAEVGETAAVMPTIMPPAAYAVCSS